MRADTSICLQSEKDIEDTYFVSWNVLYNEWINLGFFILLEDMDILQFLQHFSAGILI
jgi:hypothetical protein